MLHVSWEMMIFIIIGGFVAAYVDSVVGGGGLIALPVLTGNGVTPGYRTWDEQIGGHYVISDEHDFFHAVRECRSESRTRSVLFVSLRSCMRNDGAAANSI